MEKKREKKKKKEKEKTLVSRDEWTEGGKWRSLIPITTANEEPERNLRRSGRSVSEARKRRRAGPGRRGKKRK